MRTRIDRAAARTAHRTPEHRDRFVDLLRAASILMVVIGHWLVVAISVDDGRLAGRNVLGVLAWTHPLTWLFQVMPMFFLVGGFANAASWFSHRRERGGRWVAWVLRRTSRLLRPTTSFLAICVAAVAATRALGLDPDLVEDAGWLVNVALWFLAVYVVVAAAAPIMLAAHERWGPAVLGVLVLVVLAVDVARIGLELEVVGLANFALGWLALQQLGFLWRDGTLTRSRLIPAGMAVGGLLVLVGLTTIGSYPVSMVGVPRAKIDNTAPPTLALLALGAAQAGIALWVRPLFDRVLERPRVWLAVVAVNARILTIYLWHLVPVVLVSPLLLAVPDLVEAPIGSGEWLALRPAWVAVLAVLLVVIVLALGPIEGGGRPRDPDPSPGGVVATIAAAAGIGFVSAGLALFTLGGLHGEGPLGLPLPAIASYGAGLLLLRAAGRLGSPGYGKAPGGEID